MMTSEDAHVEVPIEKGVDVIEKEDKLMDGEQSVIQNVDDSKEEMKEKLNEATLPEEAYVMEDKDIKETNLESNESSQKLNQESQEELTRSNNPSDLDIIRAQLESDGASSTPTSVPQSEEQNNPSSLGPQEELNRLRMLVLATRGGKGQLPPGWSDEPDSEFTIQEEILSKSEIENDEGKNTKANGEKSEILVDSALSKAGLTEMSDSEDDEDDESSESESSSSDDSSSSSGESSSGSKKGKTQNRKKKVIEPTNYDSDEDDADASGSGARGPVTKNELLEPTLDVPPYSTVPPDLEMRSLGKIHSIVDSVVVVSQDTGKAPGSQINQIGGQNQDGEYSVLDTGSLLAFEDRNVLGVVYETFGSVQAPLYALRYASSSQINFDQIKIGRPVFYVPGDSSYILTRVLRAMGKGSDASNLWDEEVGDDEREFSDDEAEAAFKKDQKAKRSAKHGGGNEQQEGPKAKKRNSQSGIANKPNVIRHGLPARPMDTALPSSAHIDADFTSNSRTMPLPYDDDGQGNSIPSLDSAYAALPQNQSPSLYSPASATHFQHIRPRGGPSNGMRGRGRGRGRGGYHHGHSQTGGSPQGVYNPAFGNQQTLWDGNVQNQPQQWTASYPQTQTYQTQPQSLTNWQATQQQQQPYSTQYSQPQYPSYGSAYGNAQAQSTGDSSSSYDPSQPLFPYPTQTAGHQFAAQQQQPSQYGYVNQNWASQQYPSTNGNPPPTQ